MSTSYVMTAESVEDFLAHSRGEGATANMIRRLSCATRVLYEHLPEDKVLTREQLLSWRKSMEEKGYASQTILNYVKYINLYLDFIGASDIRFTRGHPKNIAGMTFGYLTAIEPTEKRDRKDVVWICKCKCGNTVEMPATRMLMGNTLSCGCLNKEHFQRANKYIDQTSLRQALEEKTENPDSASGYIGVYAIRGKWVASITYKGKCHSLGTYAKKEDAIKARARAKQLVQEDALELLDIYEELHKEDEALPNKQSLEKPDFHPKEWRANRAPGSAATRANNSSGYTGVSRKRDGWKASISFNGKRYPLGFYRNIEEAVAIRKEAEKALRADPDSFPEWHRDHYTASRR